MRSPLYIIDPMYSNIDVQIIVVLDLGMSMILKVMIKDTPPPKN